MASEHEHRIEIVLEQQVLRVAMQHVLDPVLMSQLAMLDLAQVKEIRLILDQRIFKSNYFSSGWCLDGFQ